MWFRGRAVGSIRNQNLQTQSPSLEEFHKPERLVVPSITSIQKSQSSNLINSERNSAVNLHLASPSEELFSVPQVVIPSIPLAQLKPNLVRQSSYDVKLVEAQSFQSLRAQLKNLQEFIAPLKKEKFVPITACWSRFFRRSDSVKEVEDL